MFGNKVIDFNQDSSAFKNIRSLIKNGEHLLQLGGGYRLVILYQVSSERYTFEVRYDSQG